MFSKIREKLKIGNSDAKTNSSVSSTTTITTITPLPVIVDDASSSSSTTPTPIGSTRAVNFNDAKLAQTPFRFGSYSIDFTDLVNIKLGINLLENGASVEEVAQGDLDVLLTLMPAQEAKHYAGHKEELKHRHYFRGLIAEKLLLKANTPDAIKQLAQNCNLTEESVEKHFVEAAKLGNSRAIIKLGDIHWKKRNYEKAIHWYTQITKLANGKLLDIFGTDEFLRLAVQFYDYIVIHKNDKIVSPFYQGMKDYLFTIPHNNLTIKNRLDLSRLIANMPHDKSDLMTVHLSLQHATSGFYQCHHENNFALIDALRERIEWDLCNYLADTKLNFKILKNVPLLQRESLELRNTELHPCYYTTLLQFIAILHSDVERLEKECKISTAQLGNFEQDTDLLKAKYKYTDTELAEHRKRVEKIYHQDKDNLDANKKKQKELYEVFSILPGLTDFAMDFIQKPSPTASRREHECTFLGARLFLDKVVTARVRLDEMEIRKKPAIEKLLAGLGSVSSVTTTASVITTTAAMVTSSSAGPSSTLATMYAGSERKAAMTQAQSTTTESTPRSEYPLQLP